jgi:predicted small lipoprotein YifL
LTDPRHHDGDGAVGAAGPTSAAWMTKSMTELRRVLTGRRSVLAVLLVAVSVAGCGLVTGGPHEVTPAELVEEQDRYDGEMVVVEGTVRTYDDPRHYWIEDDHPNRVELEPHEAAAPHVGERVRVQGEFSFQDDVGRIITVDELEVLDE